MQTLAHQAYGQVQNRTAGNKELEAKLFSQITQDLQTVQSTEDPLPAVFADAVSRNLQMWTILSADLLSPGNEMPDEIKRTLLNLAGFVRNTSMRVLAGEGDLADLIDINVMISDGLRGNTTTTL